MNKIRSLQDELLEFVTDFYTELYKNNESICLEAYPTFKTLKIFQKFDELDRII